MTIKEAVHQLEMVAEICTTTALAEACLMGARLLEWSSNSCDNCKYKDVPDDDYPCVGCAMLHSYYWEAKEGEEHETD